MLVKGVTTTRSSITSAGADRVCAPSPAMAAATSDNDSAVRAAMAAVEVNMDWAVLGEPETRIMPKARTARLAAAEWGSRGPHGAAAWGLGRSPI